MRKRTEWRKEGGQRRTRVRMREQRSPKRIEKDKEEGKEKGKMDGIRHKNQRRRQGEEDEGK